MAQILKYLAQILKFYTLMERCPEQILKSMQRDYLSAGLNMAYLCAVSFHAHIWLVIDFRESFFWSVKI